MTTATRDNPATAAPDNQPWVRGELSGLDIPADARTLLTGGADFLTRAFRWSGALGGDNRVTNIVAAEEFFGGGTGAKLVLEVTYANPAPGLPNRLFVKFSRNFDEELRDRGRFMMVSEVRFAALSRTPDFPVAVPACLFADVEPASATGLIISERLPFGSGNLEPLYAKCMDYRVPESLAHYRAIITSLARLAGTHRGGGLPPEFDRQFPYQREQAIAALTLRTPLEKLLRWAERMFAFINLHPQLFPANILAADFQQRYIADIPDVVAAEASIRELLNSNPDYIALCHWNANIDNSWFWRDADGQLHAGLMDWAMVGQMNVAQSIGGAIGGAERHIWDNHLDELLELFITEYAAHGGPPLALDELRRQVLLMVAMAGVSHLMGAPIAIQREIPDLSGVTSYQDPCFQQHENARIQLHMMTKMLNVWQTRKLGDLVREVLPRP